MIQGDKHRLLMDFTVLTKEGKQIEIFNKASIHPLMLAPEQTILQIRSTDNDGVETEYDVYILKRLINPRPKPGLVSYFAVEVHAITQWE